MQRQYSEKRGHITNTERSSGDNKRGLHKDELTQRETIVAHNFLGNQFAHCDLVIDNGISGGMLNMVKENTDHEKYFSVEEYGKEE